MPSGIYPRHLEILQAIEHNSREQRQWPIYHPQLLLDIVLGSENNGIVSKDGERFRFAPYTEQANTQKVHIIRLPVEFGSRPISLKDMEGTAAPCCGSSLKRELMNYTFGGGDNPRLECAVKDTPVLRCQCGHTYLETHIALPIKQKARIIREYFDFQTQEDYEAISKILPSSEIAKVRDFVETLRQQEPFSPRAILYRKKQQRLSPIIAFVASVASNADQAIAHIRLPIKQF